jgi:tyrosine aminotransferase
MHGSLCDVEAGAKRLSQIIHGASHLSQAIIPGLLSPSSPRVGEWKRNLCATLERQAIFLCSRLDACDGLEVIQPQGAIYAIAKIDTTLLDVKDDIEFASKLLDEENVFVLPGSAFGVQNIFRVAYCSSEPILETAAKRISDFCHRHANTLLR